MGQGLGQQWLEEQEHQGPARELGPTRAVGQPCITTQVTCDRTSVGKEIEAEKTRE